MPSHSSQTPEPLDRVLLSPVESYFWRFEKDLRGAFRVIVLLRLNGLIEADFLCAALRQLQGRHPKLRAAITQGDDGRLSYEFAPAPPPIPFEIKDCDNGETPWREETHRLMQMDFPAVGPLAAVSVLRSPSCGCSELLLALPHALADGMSALMLMDDLLTAYAKAEAQIELQPDPGLLAVRATRVRQPGGWRGGLRLTGRFARLQLEERRSGVTSLPEARHITPHSQWVHWVFSSEDTVALVRRCRKERASLSGALVSAVCCGLMDCLPSPEALFKWQLPFNIRNTLEGSAGPINAQDLGCFVSNMNGLMRITRPPAFWDLARSVHGDIQAFVHRGGPSFSYNVTSACYSMWVAVRRWFGRPAATFMPSDKQRETLLATHYGVLSLQDAYGSLHPRECTLTFKNEITGPSLIIESLVIGQRLNIGFAADDLDPAFWEQLQMAVRRRLEAAISARATSPIEREPPRAANQDEAAPQRMSAADGK